MFDMKLPPGVMMMLQPFFEDSFVQKYLGAFDGVLELLICASYNFNMRVKDACVCIHTHIAGSFPVPLEQLQEDQKPYFRNRVSHAASETKSPTWRRGSFSDRASTLELIVNG